MTPSYATPAALKAAWDEGAIRTFPQAARITGLARDPTMGELAGRSAHPAGSTAGCARRRWPWRSTSARRSAPTPAGPRPCS